jgi:hypothetical protein
MHDLEVANLQDEVERLTMENILLNRRISELTEKNTQVSLELQSLVSFIDGYVLASRAIIPSKIFN